MSPKKILVIDDFSQMRSTLKQMLQSIGFSEIDTATDGKGALDQLARRAYDIVLCDYNLGEGKDGQQVLEEAKHRNLIGYSTVFVMITAENTVEMVMGAMEYKPDDYLTKPFNKDLLRSRLDKLLARKADFDQIEAAVQKGELRRGISLCEERIAKKPKNLSEFMKLKAELCLRTGDLEEAEKVYAAILAVREVPWAKVGLGQVRFKQGRYAEARDIFQEIVDQQRTQMEAHDWLAKSLERLGDTKRAQEVLANAAQLSPKAILRQQALGDLAFRNADFDAAENAFRKTVNLGRESVFRKPGHYTRLAKVLSKNGSGKDAIKTLDAARKEFRGDEKALLETTVVEGLVLRDQGRENDAKKAFDEAATLFEATGGGAGTDVALDMAKACLLFGEKEKGLALIQDVVRNNHEEEAVLGAAQEIFADVGLEDEGRELIAATTREVAHLNNEGVRLVKEGKLEKALQLFEEAVGSMPHNRTVNLNTAQAMLIFMQKRGRDERYLQLTRQYLDRVKAVDPSDSKLQKLMGVFERVAASSAA